MQGNKHLWKFNLLFQKTSILFKTFGFSFRFGGNLLWIAFKDMKKGETSTKSTVLQQGQEQGHC